MGAGPLAGRICMTIGKGQSIEAERETSAAILPFSEPHQAQFIFHRPHVLMLWAGAAVGLFQLAYSFSQLSFLILAYPLCMIQLARASTARQSFYFGLAVGLINAAVLLSCFWTIFGPSAIALWCIFAFWIGLFTALAHMSLVQLGKWRSALLLPFLWTGLEYFRSEIYYLRFSWLNSGFALSDSGMPHLFRWFGVYGVGFAAVAIAVLVLFLPPRKLVVPAILFGPPAFLIILLISQGYAQHISTPAGKAIQVAGMQLEFPITAEVIAGLNSIVRQKPEAQLLVLSEYTFDSEVPLEIKTWCRKNRRYLIVGGKEPAPGNNFYNTAFVINPEGDIAFRQGKSVPIQFFKDGLPARDQKSWESPWGRIGICICYDLSYTRVVDKLVRSGAQAIIVPTMDVSDWGRGQHELHARIAPVRSAEYGVGIFRVASSGISQCTDRLGRVVAKAGFPGQGEIIFGSLALAAQRGTLPLDRWLAPLSLGVTIGFIVWLVITRYLRRSRALSKSAAFERLHTG